MSNPQADDLRKVVDPSLRGRVAIVTGAGQGIGRIFAKAFAMAGAIPVIAERNHETRRRHSRA
jgi:NAD(P)-dependent dehydrogenase (short-subunit alcohol dehydrogenase family)